MNDLELDGALKESANDVERTLVRRQASATVRDEQTRGPDRASASAVFQKELKKEAERKAAHPQAKWVFVFPAAEQEQEGISC